MAEQRLSIGQCPRLQYDGMVVALSQDDAQSLSKNWGDVADPANASVAILPSNKKPCWHPIWIQCKSGLESWWPGKDLSINICDSAWTAKVFRCSGLLSNLMWLVQDPVGCIKVMLEMWKQNTVKPLMLVVLDQWWCQMLKYILSRECNHHLRFFGRVSPNLVIMWGLMGSG